METRARSAHCVQASLASLSFPVMEKRNGERERERGRGCMKKTPNHSRVGRRGGWRREEEEGVENGGWRERRGAGWRGERRVCTLSLPVFLCPLHAPVTTLWAMPLGRGRAGRALAASTGRPPFRRRRPAPCLEEGRETQPRARCFPGRFFALCIDFLEPCESGPSIRARSRPRRRGRGVHPFAGPACRRAAW